MISTATITAQKRMAYMALFSFIAILFPHTGLQGHEFNSESLLFDTSTASKASLLHVMAKNEDEYLPSKKTINITVTSYNSEPGQTDATPFITAFGTQVRDGIVATNYLPKGTKVRFPDLYGEKIFVVEDRMNIRYTKQMDIWSADKEFSRAFGARYLRMEIL
jgi:3D (Asp-Asp-Asp) domain-containing protein